MSYLVLVANAIAGMLLLAPLILFSVLAFWKLHPVLFIMLAGISLVSACYMPDILTGGTTTTLSLTVALSVIGYALANIGFSFMMIFRGGKNS